MKRSILLATIFMVMAYLISCKAAEPVQNATSMDDTWYVMTETNILMFCKADESQKEYIEAIKLLKSDCHSVETAIEKLKSMEQTAKVKNALGVGMICLAKFDEADALLNEALKLAEEDSEKVCILYNQIYVSESLGEDSFGKSIMDKYNSIVEKKISDPIQNLVLRSNFLALDLKENNTEKSIQTVISTLEELLRKEKDLLGTNQMIGIYNYMQLASMYIEFEVDIQRGIDYLNQALKLNEETYQYPIMDIALFDWLSNTYAALKQFDKALEYRERYIEQGEKFYIKGHPNLISAYFSRNLTLFRAGRYDDAIASYEKLAKEIDPGDSALGIIYYNMGLSYYKKDNMEKAVEHFTKSYTVYSNHEEAQEDMIDAKNKLQQMYEKGSYSEIAPDFDKWMQEQIKKYGPDI